MSTDKVVKNDDDEDFSTNRTYQQFSNLLNQSMQNYRLSLPQITKDVNVKSMIEQTILCF